MGESVENVSSGTTMQDTGKYDRLGTPKDRQSLMKIDLIACLGSEFKKDDKYTLRADVVSR